MLKYRQNFEVERRWLIFKTAENPLNTKFKQLVEDSFTTLLADGKFAEVVKMADCCVRRTDFSVVVESKKDCEIALSTTPVALRYNATRSNRLTILFTRSFTLQK